MSIFAILFTVFWFAGLFRGLYVNRADWNAAGGFTIEWFLIGLLGLAVYFGYK